MCNVGLALTYWQSRIPQNVIYNSYNKYTSSTSTLDLSIWQRCMVHVQGLLYQIRHNAQVTHLCNYFSKWFHNWPVDLYFQACVVVKVSSSTGWIVVGVRFKSLGRTLQMLVRVTYGSYSTCALTSCCSMEAQSWLNSTHMCCSPNDALEKMHVVLMPFWSQGAPWPSHQLDSVWVKEFSPRGQSQIPTTHKLGIDKRSNSGTYHFTCNMRVAIGMLFVKKFTNILCVNGVIASFPIEVPLAKIWALESTDLGILGVPILFPCLSTWAIEGSENDLENL